MGAMSARMRCHMPVLSCAAQRVLARRGAGRASRRPGNLGGVRHAKRERDAGDLHVLAQMRTTLTSAMDSWLRMEETSSLRVGSETGKCALGQV
jgi:hypothetical protein